MLLPVQGQSMPLRSHSKQSCIWSKNYKLWGLGGRLLSNTTASKRIGIETQIPGTHVKIQEKGNNLSCGNIGGETGGSLKFFG